MPATTAVCGAVAGDRHGALLGSAEHERLSVRLAADVHAAPGLLGDLDADARDLTMSGEDAAAQREADDFELSAGMLAHDLMHEGLEDLAGNDPVGAAFEKCRGEFPLETDRDGQVARIVPIATAHDAQHAQPGFTLAARSQTRHRRTVAFVSWRRGFAVRGFAVGVSSNGWVTVAAVGHYVATFTPILRPARREPANREPATARL